jgi:hypothetical protein
MQERLDTLRAEYQRGLNELALLDQRRQELHRTLLRISGAIQVLEELLAEPPTSETSISSPQGGSPAIHAVGS